MLLFTRLLPGRRWLSRWPIGAMIGAHAGLQLIGFLQGDLIAQVQANVLGEHGQHGDELQQLPLIAGVLTTLVYFFFSTGAPGRRRRALQGGHLFPS
ncbi:MAG: hypothetical protein IPK72_22430 [Candidatus Eisenbacteria bacterium]|nr:hypothetical protein [Candidatus Eisenbacteria bacterium]